jgi:hypothetical protein
MTWKHRNKPNPEYQLPKLVLVELGVGLLAWKVLLEAWTLLESHESLE